MTWWEVIKTDWINKTMARSILRNIKLINSHPDFAGIVTYIRGDVRDITRKVYESVEDLEDVEFLLENFTPQELREANTGLDYFQTKLAQKRSMGFLEEMADTLGIDIQIVDDGGEFANPVASFEFDGLYYDMSDEGVFIRMGADFFNRIFVCVVDSQKLPIGDYFASLAGLIVNDPDRVPTLGFGIRLARILKSNPGVSSILRFFEIRIFTPFGAEEADMDRFVNLLDILKDNLRENILQEIKQALEESFGDTRGFF